MTIDPIIIETQRTYLDAARRSLALDMRILTTGREVRHPGMRTRSAAGEERWLQWLSRPLELGDGEPADLPYVVRSNPRNQDFRTFENQPNGMLLFSVPEVLALDGARLAERELTAEVLAASSPMGVTGKKARRPPKRSSICLSIFQPGQITSRRPLVSSERCSRTERRIDSPLGSMRLRSS